MASRLIQVDDFDLVIFGATGDLARRKILPALFRRHAAGQFPPDARIIGAARSRMDDAAFRAGVAAAIAEFDPARAQSPELPGFLNRLSYIAIDAAGDSGWPDLAARMRPGVVQAFYLSVAPSLFGDIARRLTGHSIAGPEARIVAEKPFGRDLDTARALNRTLVRHFPEAQIYRIDHYLGKETVQNLMAVRFANILFEPLWNALYIDHVQITVAETVGVAGRGAYYDHAGAMRDMVQNHLMQLLCLIAMEPPYHFDPDAVRDEKLKVIRALEPVAPADVVRGQYAAGAAPSYAQDVDNPHSRTESFVALKLRIANWRWQGVPFYARSGKQLSAKTTEIALQFKAVPHLLFPENVDLHANRLSIIIQPNESLHLCIEIKVPGLGMRVKTVDMEFHYEEHFGEDVLPEAYERLLLDALQGDASLFARSDEIEMAWALIDPLTAEVTPELYEPGSAGPPAADALMSHDGRRWLSIVPQNGDDEA